MVTDCTGTILVFFTFIGVNTYAMEVNILLVNYFADHFEDYHPTH